MELWNAGNYAQLSEIERRVIEGRIPLMPGGGERPSPVAYLNETGAGLTQIRAMVEEDRAYFKTALGRAADRLFDLGDAPSSVIALVDAFASATPEQRQQVAALLLPPPPPEG